MLFGTQKQILSPFLLDLLLAQQHQHAVWDPKANPLAIPPGQADNILSVQVEKDTIA
jgi:hypothetical protein